MLPAAAAASRLVAAPTVLAFGLVYDNPPLIVDVARLIVSLVGGVAFGISLTAYLRERRGPWVSRHRPLYYLALLVTGVSSFGEVQQLGEPFIVYQLPSRAIAIVLTWLVLRQARLDRQAAGDSDRARS